LGAITTTTAFAKLTEFRQTTKVNDEVQTDCDRYSSSGDEREVSPKEAKAVKIKLKLLRFFL
jgi:hypothetical protein